MKKENKEPRNKNGLPHGLWERYLDNGITYSRCYYVNGIKHGISEGFWGDSSLDFQGCYFKGKKHGVWYGFEYDNEGKYSINLSYYYRGYKMYQTTKNKMML